MPSSQSISPYLIRVLRRVNRGDRNDKIAASLGLTVRSVERYVSRLFELLGAGTRYDLVVKARKLGMISVPRTGGLQETTLSRTEVLVLRHARYSLSPSEIARRIGTSAGTVTVTLANARRKLGTRSNLAAVDEAIHRGLLGGQPPDKLKNPLTKRECDIIAGIAQGLTAREIANEFGLTRAAINSRVPGIRAKLRARNNEEMLDTAERLGILRRLARQAHVSRNAIETFRRERRTLHLTPRRFEIFNAFLKWPQATHLELANRFGLSKASIDQHSVILQRLFGVTSKAALLKIAKTTTVRAK